MKVKVGDIVYTSKHQPIMVILTDQDKRNIAKMLPDCAKYCEFSEDAFTSEEIEEWMYEGC